MAAACGCPNGQLARLRRREGQGVLGPRAGFHWRRHQPVPNVERRSMALNQAIDVASDQRETLISLHCRHLPITEAWICGLRAQGASRPSSDLDMVAFATPGQARELSRLRESNPTNPAIRDVRSPCGACKRGQKLHRRRSHPGFTPCLRASAGVPTRTVPEPSYRIASPPRTFHLAFHDAVRALQVDPVVVFGPLDGGFPPRAVDAHEPLDMRRCRPRRRKPLALVDRARDDRVVARAEVLARGARPASRPCPRTPATDWAAHAVGASLRIILLGPLQQSVPKGRSSGFSEAFRAGRRLSVAPWDPGIPPVRPFSRTGCESCMPPVAGPAQQGFAKACTPVGQPAQKRACIARRTTLDGGLHLLISTGRKG